MTRGRIIASWIAQLVAALILLQTLFFKFTAAPESVYIFERLDAEPWGRVGSGAVELIAAVLLLWPTRAAWGALLAASVMAGAIGSHFFVLGISVQDDGGTLFALAWIVLISSVTVLALRHHQLPLPGRQQPVNS